MESLAELYKKDKFLHHAYLIEGEHQSSLLWLKKFFKEMLNINPDGNPDASLPDTGGPQMGLIPLGAMLVVAGAMVVGRRRMA